MNNAKIALDNVSLELEETIDIKPTLRTRETKLVAILDAIDHIKGSNYWKVIQSEVLNLELEKLQRRLRDEKNPTELYRLQGQITWAEKHSDLDKLAQAYRNELSGIRKQL